jgi:hypothetical protein
MVMFDVCYWHLADIDLDLQHVRSWGQSRHPWPSTIQAPSHPLGLFSGIAALSVGGSSIERHF